MKWQESPDLQLVCLLIWRSLVLRFAGLPDDWAGAQLEELYFPGLDPARLFGHAPLKGHAHLLGAGLIQRKIRFQELVHRRVSTFMKCQLSDVE
jgi:hypothetical protein